MNLSLIHGERGYPWSRDTKTVLVAGWIVDLVYHHYVSAENSKRKKVFIYKVNIHERET